MSTIRLADLSGPVVDQAADAIIVADREGRVQVWNAAAEAVFGYPQRDAIGQRLDLIIPERFRSAHWAAFDRAIATGHTTHGGEAITTRSLDRNGTDLYVDVSFALLTGVDDVVLGVVAVARDVTARHAAERELRRRIAALEQQLRAFTSPDG